VRFGDATLLLVTSPTEDLGGNLFGALPWIVAGVGLVATAGSCLFTEALLRRRDRAEQLADENGQLLAQQRSVAHILQQSLLPEDLPTFPDVAVSVVYQPGAADLEVGGDWYDVIALEAGRLLAVVGDVSGRGVRAATVMASLRYSIRAFASEGDDPATILAKLNAMTTIAEGFATVVCALVDVDGHRIVLANAGHPPPILVGDGDARVLETHVGPPIGAVTGVTYQPVVVEVAPGTTLLLFTDGLFERRGEAIDDGLERLRLAVAAVDGGSLDDLLRATIRAQDVESGPDDTALLGLRWEPTAAGLPGG
jgi:serine phosphatase RsbU (regulator of sigma subunit)